MKPSSKHSLITEAQAPNPGSEVLTAAENYPPRRKRIMPIIPAMLVTRFPSAFGDSTNRISPEGRSMTRAGALGDEGDRKVYCEAEAVTLMSRKGLTEAIEAVLLKKSCL